MFAAMMAFSPVPAGAQGEPHQSAPGKGLSYHGVGHAKNHSMYKGWLTKKGGSCCNNQDCRPTKAKYVILYDQEMYRVEVNGVWCLVPVSAARPYTPRDGQAHVCAPEVDKSLRGEERVTKICESIICFVAGAGG